MPSRISENFAAPLFSRVRTAASRACTVSLVADAAAGVAEGLAPALITARRAWAHAPAAYRVSVYTCSVPSGLAQDTRLRHREFGGPRQHGVFGLGDDVVETGFGVEEGKDNPVSPTRHPAARERAPRGIATRSMSSRRASAPIAPRAAGALPADCRRAQCALANVCGHITEVRTRSRPDPRRGPSFPPQQRIEADRHSR